MINLNKWVQMYLFRLNKNNRSVFLIVFEIFGSPSFEMLKKLTNDLWSEKKYGTNFSMSKACCLKYNWEWCICNIPEYRNVQRF